MVGVVELQSEQEARAALLLVLLGEQLMQVVLVELLRVLLGQVVGVEVQLVMI
jgi:hypothetical protein